MVRMDAIANALLNQEDVALRDQILQRLAEKGTFGHVGRNCTLVQLRGDWERSLSDLVFSCNSMETRLVIVWIAVSSACPTRMKWSVGKRLWRLRI